MGWKIFRSKTFWGAVILGVAKIIANPTPDTIMEAIGIVVVAAGARDAIHKVNPTETPADAPSQEPKTP